MQKVGKLVTCERCGRTIFLEDEIPMYTSKDIGEECKYGASNEEWGNWRIVIGGQLTPTKTALNLTPPPEPKDLCPECAAHYERMMGYFWNGAKVNIEEENEHWVKANPIYLCTPPRQGKIIEDVKNFLVDEDGVARKD